jgi:E3 ubiquitin-protein ligase MYCBP2
LDIPYWNAKPAPMPNIGSKYGRKATWIGASGDQTFLRIDEALINSHVLATSEIFASKHIIGKYLVFLMRYSCIFLCACVIEK